MGQLAKRNFAFVVFKDSAPSDWLDQLKDLHIPMFVSPFHDKDIDPHLDQPKKPHYHVMVMFEGKKSISQVQSLFDGIAANNHIEEVNSLRGYARYLCHLDNPEKVRYEPDSVVCLSGADYHSVIGLALDKYKAIQDMQWYCIENGITSFSRLADYALSERPDWFRVLCDSSIYMREYLKSRHFSEK